jgi:hypothetical protein
MKISVPNSLNLKASLLLFRTGGLAENSIRFIQESQDGQNNYIIFIIRDIAVPPAPAHGASDDRFQQAYGNAVSDQLCRGVGPRVDDWFSTFTSSCSNAFNRGGQAKRFDP